MHVHSQRRATVPRTLNFPGTQSVPKRFFQVAKVRLLPLESQNNDGQERQDIGGQQRTYQVNNFGFEHHLLPLPISRSVRLT